MSKEIKIHSVKYNLIMNMILKLSTVIFPFITFPYISRVLGATYNGKIAFATSVIYYFAFLASLGIPTYGVKICAQYRDDKEKLSKIVKELLIISTITMAISYVLFAGAMVLVPKFQEERVLLLITSVTIMLSVWGVEWFYQAIEQYDYITYRNLAFKIIAILLMFGFVHKEEDYLLYATISVFSAVGSNILNLIRLRKYVSFKKTDSLELIIHMKPIMTLFMVSAASMIYSSLDSVMLGFISGDTEVGLYNAAVKVKNILISLVTALGTVLLPRLSNYVSSGNTEEFNRLIKKSFSFSLLCSLPFALYCIIEAKNCILFLAGEGYQGAILPMQLISPSIVFISLTNIIGIQILIATGKEFYTFLSTLAGAIVNLTLNAIFIQSHASSGAAFATTIAEIVVFLVQIIYVIKELKHYMDWKNYAKIFGSLVVSGLVLIILERVIIINSVFLGIVFSGVFFFGVYGVLLVALKEEIIYGVLVGLIRNVLKRS